MKLEIGDKIYFRSYGLNCFQKVIKITPTTAKTERYNLENNVSDTGYIRIKGEKSKWDRTTAWIATPELDKEWEDMAVKHWFSEQKDKFTLEQIWQIFHLLNPNLKTDESNKG